MNFPQDVAPIPLIANFVSALAVEGVRSTEHNASATAEVFKSLVCIKVIQILVDAGHRHWL